MCNRLHIHQKRAARVVTSSNSGNLRSAEILNERGMGQS